LLECTSTKVHVDIQNKKTSPNYSSCLPFKWYVLLGWDPV
jgi:hypothetical protein